MAFTARFPGMCSACYGEIEPGQTIAWTPRKTYEHLDCQGEHGEEDKPKLVTRIRGKLAGR